MTANPPLHRRRSIRLKGYDYALPGAYFITLCTYDRLPLFGTIVRAGLAPARMELNEFGSIAREQWLLIPTRFDNTELDAFIIMPNHIHGILVLKPFDRGGETPQPQGLPQREPQREIGSGQPQGLPQLEPQRSPQLEPQQELQRLPQQREPQREPQRETLRTTVGDIVGAYKSLVSNECLKIYKTRNQTMGKIWQRNYYEHIIRDEKSWRAIHEYILNNPARWGEDSLHPGGKP